MKDKEYADDKHVVLRDWGEARTVLTNIAVSLTNLLHQGERTIKEIKEIRERCCVDPIPFARKLGWNRETC